MCKKRSEDCQVVFMSPYETSYLLDLYYDTLVRGLHTDR